MRTWQAWTCTLITFTGSGTIRSSIKQLQCNAYYFTGPNDPRRPFMRKRRRPRPQPDCALSLVPVTQDCPECQHRLRARYNNFRTITTLDGVLRLTLAIRRCTKPDCPRFLRPYRPEAEPHFALPYH